MKRYEECLYIIVIPVYTLLCTFVSTVAHRYSAQDDRAEIKPPKRGIQHIALINRLQVIQKLFVIMDYICFVVLSV